MFKRIKALWNILKQIKRIEQLEERLKAAKKDICINISEIEGLKMEFEILKRPVDHYDIHPHSKGASYVIAVGRFRGRDYVSCCPIPEGEFERTVDMISHYRKKGYHRRLGRIDAPNGFKAVIGID